MAEIKEKRRELESQRAARESGATATIRQQIAELESQRAAGEAKHVRAEAEANKGAYERISNLRYLVNTIETDIMHAEQDKKEHENEIQRLNHRREKLLADWNEENEKEWSGSEICPTCGQQLPAEQIEEAKENFNTAKAQRLEAINQRGIDDIGSEQPTEWGVSKIFAIINARYEGYMPTIITTNYSGPELVQRMTPESGDSRNAEKTLDRLKETCVGIDMTWESWRAK